MHFLGIKWDNQEKNPWIVYRKNQSSEEVLSTPILSGKKISIQVNSSKFCIGSFKHPEYIREVCRSNESVVGKSFQCDSCRSKDSTYFLPINTLNYEQLNILKDQPHLNYINIFGNNIIKTGVAAKVRNITRQLEQGAIASVFFADTDGSTSRLIESHISKLLNIRQAVSWNSKLRFVKEIPQQEEAFGELRKIYEQIVSRINSRYVNSLIRNPVYLYNYDYYFISELQDIYEIGLTNQILPNDAISGIIVGIYGEIILLKQEDGAIFALNTRSLLGYLIEISDESFSTNLASDVKSIELFVKPYKNLTLF